MRVRFLAKANADLIEIGDYYRDLGGNPLATKLVRGIRRDVSTILADNPLAAPVYELLPGLRRLVVTKGAFLVFYRVADFIDVVHVRRAERAPVDAEDLSPDSSQIFGNTG